MVISNSSKRAKRKSDLHQVPASSIRQKVRLSFGPLAAVADISLSVLYAFILALQVTLAFGAATIVILLLLTCVALPAWLVGRMLNRG